MMDMGECKFLFYRINDLWLTVETCRYATSSYDILDVYCIHSGWSEELWIARGELACILLPPYINLHFPFKEINAQSIITSLMLLLGSPGEGNGNPFWYSCLEISWTEEPGGPQIMGSQRVRHDWAVNTHSAIANSKFQIGKLKGTTIITRCFTPVNWGRNGKRVRRNEIEDTVFKC